MGAGILPILGAAGSVFQGVSGYQQAKGEKQRAETNAYIGRTRAIQTNVQAREGLNSELGTLRATFAANGQRPGVGTDVIFNELRRTSNRDRRIEFGNEMAGVADQKMAAANAGAAGRGALLGGIIKAGPDLFDIYSNRKKYFGGP